MKKFQQTINEVEEESDHEYKQYQNFFDDYQNNDLIIEDPFVLQKEYEAESQNAQAQQYQPIVLVPMNEYQLAQIYMDKQILSNKPKIRYPLLRLRKYILLLTLNIKRICLRVLQSYYFQILNLLVILMNSVLIAIKYYNLPIERLFLYFYTFEVIITFSGQGFIKYWTELWNILDLAVIISAYLYIEDGMNVDLTSLRIFKIIKQINMFSHIVVLNKILRSLLLSLLQLKDAFVFLLISYSIFAIVGLQLFSGILKYRCIYEETGIVLDQNICSSCDNQFFCAKTNENPHLNQISFDSFGWALLQVFIGTTMEGWSRIMGYLIEATSYASSIYFLLIILMGGYFLVNLTLAVIKLNFSHYQQIEAVLKEDIIYNYRELRKLNIYVPERVTNANKLLQMSKSKRHMRKSKTMLHSHNKDFDKYTNKVRIHPKEPSIQINRVFKENPQKNKDTFASLSQQRQSTQKFLPLHRLSVGSNALQISPRFIRDIDVSPNNSKFSIAADPKSMQSNSSIKQQDQFVEPQKQPSPRTSVQKVNKQQVQNVTIKTQSVSLEQQKLKTKLFLTQFHVKISNSIYQPTSISDILRPKSIKLDQVDTKKFKKENQLLYYKFRNQTTLMTGSYAHNSYPTQSSWIQKSKSLNNTIMKKSIINSKKKSVPKINQYSYLIRKINKEVQEDYVIEEHQTHLKKEYLKIKNQKSLEIEASLEDVLTISDFLLDDQKFINHMNNILKSLNYTQSQYDIWLPGLQGKLRTYQKVTRQIMESQMVNRLMNLIVLGNTIVLALVGLVDDNSLDNLNLIFVIIFTIELGLKLVSYGIVGYFKDKMNSFDSIIVAISLIEILETNQSGKSSFSVFRSVRIFRALRVLRISKLIRSLKFMGFLLKVLSNASEQILYLLFLLGLLLYTYSLLGMSLFNDSIDHVSEETRDSFSTFNGSFMIAFQIMTITNWYDVLYELLQSENAYILSIPFLISLIILGNYVFLNLLLAVVLDNFEQEYRSDKRQINNKIIIAQDKIFLDANPLSPKSRRSSLNSIVLPNQLFQQVNFIYFVEQGIADNSLWVFSQENKIRRFCYRIIKDTKFEYFTLFMIVISSIKLVLDTYTIDYQIAFYIDVIVVTYFLIEGTMKIIALGFVLDQNSYLRDYWNIFDFCIIITSFVDILVSSVDLRVIKILRLFRTLRPLRFITQNRSLKVLVSALLQSTDGIINVGLVIILTWMIFAIIGINFMSGKMQYCDTGEYNYLNQQQCPGEWKNHETNFDNIFSGMLTLFILSTLVSWPYYCLYFRDGTENGPVEDANPGMFWFFAAFILLCSILLINLFIGVILVNFHIAEENSKAQYLTQEQHYWIQTQKLITDYQPNFNLYYKPQNKIRGILFSIVKFSQFELIISFNIVASIIVTALYYDDSGVSYNNQLDTMSLAFSIVLLLEATIKIIAYTPQGYFRSQLNWLDFIISVFSVLDFLVNISQGQVVKIFRVLRVIRILRLVRAIKGLKKLIDTAMYSLPAIINAAILYFLFHSIFSILGVFLFQQIRGHGIDELTNFSDFHHSFILLFRSQTGEEWYEMMFDTMHSGWYSSLFWIAFMIVQKFVMLNLFILIILDQYDRNYFQEDNPFNRFSELEKIFIESWTKYSQDGQLIDKELMLKMVMEMKEPLGFEGDKVIQTQINEWKQNNPLRKTSIKEELKMKLRGQMLTQVMMRIYEMELFCDQQGKINYKQVFFKLIKTSYLKKIIDNINSRGVTTLKKKEEESMGIIMQNFTIDEQQQVNPLVCHFYSKMAFNCLKIYSLKYIHKIRANKDFINFDSSEYSFEEESDSSDSQEYITKKKIEQIPKFCKVPDNTYYII